MPRVLVVCCLVTPLVVGCSTNKIGRYMISSEAQTEVLGMARIELLRSTGASESNFFRCLHQKSGYLQQR